jgi:chromosome segregation ATPase
MHLLSSKWVLFVTTILLITSGCVSKKKYVEMTGYRDQAENRVRELTNRVSNLETEFNTTKNDFRYSNQQKDQYIDSLNRHILGLHSNINTTSSSIEEQSNIFQIEKRRLNQLLAEKDREIRMNQQLAEERKQQLENLRGEYDAQRIQLKNAESEAYSEKSRLVQLHAEQERTAKELEQKTMENRRLQNELNTLRTEAEMLRNQVKLLKTQIGQ